MEFYRVIHTFKGHCLLLPAIWTPCLTPRSPASACPGCLTWVTSRSLRFLVQDTQRVTLPSDSGLASLKFKADQVWAAGRVGLGGRGRLPARCRYFMLRRHLALAQPSKQACSGGDILP